MTDEQIRLIEERLRQMDRERWVLNTFIALALITTVLVLLFL